MRSASLDSGPASPSAASRFHWAAKKAGFRFTLAWDGRVETVELRRSSWDGQVGRSSGTVEWDGRVGRSSGTVEWDGRVGRSSGMVEWDGRVGRSSGTVEWDGRVGWD